MEIDRFDGQTRQLSGAGSSRRAMLRTLGSLLLGGALGGVATRLGLSEDAAAKAKKHGKRQADRKQSGQLQAAGKNHKKHKNKHHPKAKNPEPLPPGCEACTECQMCHDGACVRDPALEGVRCQGSGATCGYCEGGLCTASDVRPCDDGVCPQKGQCCSGEKRCVDPESPSGFSCIPEDACCPDQKKCGGACVHRKACCPEERPQCGPCDEPYCDMQGNYHCAGTCCSDERRCPDGTCVSQGACCPGEKPCANGSCIPENECCFASSPCQGGCQRVVCVDGQEQCEPVPLGSPCKMPSGVDGTCCQGQCTQAALVCPTWPWREFNPNTCRCECAAGTVEAYPLGGESWGHYCCPGGLPYGGENGHCSAGDPTNWACIIGHHVCPCSSGKEECCCRDGT